MRKRAAEAEPETAEALLHLRVERQTIRRLPESGAILFTIRVAIDPVTAIPSEARAGLATAWRGISDEGGAYKKWPVLEPLTDHLFKTWGV